MWWGILIGAAIVVGPIVWYKTRRQYIGRKESELKQSAADLAQKGADAVKKV